MKLADLKAGNKVDHKFEAIIPQNQVNSYRAIIEMLKLTVDQSIELTNTEFRQYVLDEWDWKNHLDMVMMSNKTTIEKYE